MQTLSKISLASWAVFLVFVLSALPGAFRIYWIWASLGVLTCAFLVWGIRTGRGLALTNGIAIALLLLTYVLYWTAISTAIYAETPSDTVVVKRIENLLYLIVGNFQQGKFWSGLRIAYLQFMMPCIQLIILVRLFVLRKAKRNNPEQTTN